MFHEKSYNDKRYKNKLKSGGVGEMRNILFDLLKTNENIGLANNVSSISLSDVILPALIAKS